MVGVGHGFNRPIETYIGLVSPVDRWFQDNDHRRAFAVLTQMEPLFTNQINLLLNRNLLMNALVGVVNNVICKRVRTRLGVLYCISMSVSFMIAAASLEAFQIFCLCFPCLSHKFFFIAYDPLRLINFIFTVLLNKFIQFTTSIFL